jgi:hypothetical protein
MIIGNVTRDLTACSAVPRPTGPPPMGYAVENCEFRKDLCSEGSTLLQGVSEVLTQFLHFYPFCLGCGGGDLHSVYF